MNAGNRIRTAVQSDVPSIHGFILALAEYEKLTHEVVATEAMLHDALFGDDRVAEAWIAEADGVPAGFALAFRTYSTFVGRPGMWLEDLFVLREFRGRGLGLELLRTLAAQVVARGWGRMDWAVLDWNAPAIEFYRRIGAKPMESWLIQRLDGEALESFAGGGKSR